MSLFNNVVSALRVWLLSFPLINRIAKQATYIMFGSLGLYFLTIILISSFSFYYYSFYNLLYTLSYQGFLLGFWLVLISPDKKLAPYGLFLQALIILYPFSSINLTEFINAGIFAFFGYWLMRYTKLYSEENTTASSNNDGIAH